MKKVLLASTALVAFAGAAAADVALTGSAEMGVSAVPQVAFTYDSALGGAGIGRTVGESSTLFHQSVDVRFTLSGEADGGLAFGAIIDLDDAGDVGNPGAGLGDVRGSNPDFTVFISGDYGTLTMGDTDGAFDFAMQEVNVGAGSIADSETAHAGFNGNNGLDGFYNGQVLRYQYSFGDFAVALSTETNGDDAGFGIGGTYNLAFGGGSVIFGGGYQMADGTQRLFNLVDPDGFVPGTPDGLTVDGTDATIWGLSARVMLDAGFSAGIAYSNLEFDNLIFIDTTGGGAPVTVNAGGHEREYFGIGAAYTFDAFTVSANYGEFNGSGAAGALFDNSGFGLDAEYDLGGGLNLRAGYGHSDYDIGGTNDFYSVGLAMSF